MKDKKCNETPPEERNILNILTNILVDILKIFHKHTCNYTILSK